MTVTKWKTWLAAGLIAVAAVSAGCSGSDEIETETEIPGVDAPEVEVDE